MSNTYIILIYKNKILLFSKDILLNPSANKWGILQIPKNSKNKMIEYIQKEIIIGKNSEKQFITLNPIDGFDSNSSIYYFKLTDENVNSINRKSGWRIEFYRFDELDKILLSSGTREIFNTYTAQIENLLNS